MQLAKEAGIALTPAGSAFPHSDDPNDRNIRLAPTFPSLADVETAMAGVATCVSLAAAEKLADAEADCETSGWTTSVQTQPRLTRSRRRLSALAAVGRSVRRQPRPRP